MNKPPVNVIAEFLENFGGDYEQEGTKLTGVTYKAWCLRHAWRLHQLLQPLPQ